MLSDIVTGDNKSLKILTKFSELGISESRRFPAALQQQQQKMRWALLSRDSVTWLLTRSILRQL